VDTVEDLRDAARQARECAVVGHALPLARWIGNGRRPVTAGEARRAGGRGPGPRRTAAAADDGRHPGAAPVARDHSRDYPVCVEFRGDSPVEYWSEEEPEDPEPFGLNEVNRRLAALGREPS